MNTDTKRFTLLQVNDESMLRELASNLTQAGIDHKLWIEQPENFVTCLVTKAYLKSDIQHYFKHLHLFK